jgi:hypothetical protein
MKTRLNLSFVSAGIGLILLTGCVSSKKYKASQADLAKVRNDSAQLAQQVTSLNGNVQDLQNKNSTLQQSLEASNSRNATQQKSLDYYQNYFKEQQNTLSQVSDDVKGALTQAGIANGDVQQVNNAVYVRLDEEELFKKNSMAVTPGGKKALDNLAGVIKNRSNVNVFVGTGDSAAGPGAGGSMSGTDNNMSAPSAMADNPRPRHHRPAHVTASRNSGTVGSGSAQNGGTTSANGGATANSSTNDGKNDGAPAHKKVHHRYSSEGSMAIYNGPGHMHDRSWALKQGRMVTVANHFLKNGVPKVNVSLQQPSMNPNPQDKTIKVIITPKMEDFNPQSNSSASTQ